LLLLQVEQQVESGLEARQHAYGGTAHFIRLLAQDELLAPGVESWRLDFAGGAHGGSTDGERSCAIEPFEFADISTIARAAQRFDRRYTQLLGFARRFRDNQQLFSVSRATEVAS